MNAICSPRSIVRLQHIVVQKSISDTLSGVSPPSVSDCGVTGRNQRGLQKETIDAESRSQLLPSSLLTENASGAILAPSAPWPQAFPIKANDYADK
jgi:hypothetical protein